MNLADDDTTTPASNYGRELDVITGIVTTSFIRGGVRYTRELLVSKPAEAIVPRIRADKPGALNLLATLTRPAQVLTAPETARFVMQGQLAFDLPRAQKTPDPALDALYFQFGRHLFISGSRPDCRCRTTFKASGRRKTMRRGTATSTATSISR